MGLKVLPGSFCILGRQKGLCSMYILDQKSLGAQERSDEDLT